MEVLKDYDVTIQYHSCKANVVANRLNCKLVSMGSLACLGTLKRPLAREIQALEGRFMRLGISEKGGIMAGVDLRPTFIEEIKINQFEDVYLNEIRGKVLIAKAPNSTLDLGGVLHFRGMICVLWIDGLIQKILFESHGLLQIIPIPEWKWERISMDFMVGLPKTLGKHESIWVVVDRLTNIDMALFEDLYERGCRSPLGWFEAGEVEPLGVDLVRIAQDKVRNIQAKLLASESLQKEYANCKVMDITLEAGEKALLKVSPIKGVMRFGKKGKLNPCYIGSSDILDCVVLVAYRLVLPPRLFGIHPMFHVAILKKTMGWGLHH
ncbi:uncharacterized protein LOC129899957 [Solanum dulcamara]|uniref:uncharacterized protein LOC129899957 n=1 Tax=Solanum dulcamara TaxID=45834 RepID=UPI0024861C91|nr:uncharacterized protein LOC129899957 [Solanum dulcamara]